jgi:hypothetical protein
MAAIIDATGRGADTQRETALRLRKVNRPMGLRSCWDIEDPGFYLALRATDTAAEGVVDRFQPF